MTPWSATDTNSQDYDCRKSGQIEVANGIVSDCDCHNLCHEKYGNGCGFFEFNASAKTCALFTTRCDKVVCVKKARSYFFSDKDTRYVSNL